MQKSYSAQSKVLQLLFTKNQRNTAPVALISIDAERIDNADQDSVNWVYTQLHDLIESLYNLIN